MNQMKRNGWFVFAIVILVAFCSACDVGGGDDDDKTWAKEYVIDSQYTSAFNIEGFTEDGGALLGVNYQSLNSSVGQDIFIRIDEKGNPVWQKKYITDGIFTLKDAIEIDNGGGFIVYGRKEGNRNLMCKTDADGNVVRTISFGNQGRSSIDHFVYDPVHKSMITIGSIGAYDGLWAAKFDQNFNKIWARTFLINNANSSDEVEVNGATGLSSGGVALTGRVKFEGETNHGLFVKLSAEGAMEQQKIFAKNDDVAQEAVITIGAAIDETQDGGYIMTGRIHQYSADYDTNIGTTWVMKLDSDGNSMWSESLGHILGDGDSSTYNHKNYTERPAGVRAAKDGGYTVMGDGNRYFSMPLYDDFTAIWTIKLDADGEIEWQKRYQGNSYSTLLDPVLERGTTSEIKGQSYDFADGEGFLFSGILSKKDSNVKLVFRTDEEGEISGTPINVRDGDGEVETISIQFSDVNLTSDDIADLIVNEETVNAQEIDPGFIGEDL